MTERATVDADCRDCGRRFRFNAAFFVDRGLTSPTRCKPCRDAKRLERIAGEVVFWHQERGFGFITAADGKRYYFNRWDLGDDRGHAPVVGQSVAFAPVPSRDARNAHARRVELQRSAGAGTLKGLEEVAEHR